MYMYTHAEQPTSVNETRTRKHIFHGVSLLPFVALIWAGGSAQDHSVEHEALLTREGSCLIDRTLTYTVQLP